MTRLATSVVFFALSVGVVSLAFSSKAGACSFGPLDKVDLGYTVDSILSTMYHGCGGSVSIDRACGKSGCDVSRKKWGYQYSFCSEGSRYSADKCVLIRNGIIVEIKEGSKNEFFDYIYENF